MTGNRLLIHTIFLLLLPIAVAYYGISTIGAIAWVVIALLWRWAISMSTFIKPVEVPELELETISASHFVEKVRWCMDRLGVDYSERQMAGAFGAFFLGRTVPVLKIKTGATRSTIGNSSEILRYLWGRYEAEKEYDAEFLQANEERQAMERRLDRYGVDLQVWVYHHILSDRDLTIHLWGVNSPKIPGWQRTAVTILFPILRALIRKSFNITPRHFAKASEHIETLLGEIDSLLADGRSSILSDGEINYVDITFASISGLWLQPTGYGGGLADAVRVELDRVPETMRTDVERWKSNYPNATGFIERLYEQERK